MFSVIAETIRFCVGGLITLIDTALFQYLMITVIDTGAPEK